TPEAFKASDSNVPTFEVASIQVNKSGDPQVIRRQPGGRITVHRDSGTARSETRIDQRPRGCDRDRSRRTTDTRLTTNREMDEEGESVNTLTLLALVALAAQPQTNPNWHLPATIEALRDVKAGRGPYERGKLGLDADEFVIKKGERFQMI